MKQLAKYADLEQRYRTPNRLDKILRQISFVWNNGALQIFLSELSKPSNTKDTAKTSFSHHVLPFLGRAYQGAIHDGFEAPGTGLTSHLEDLDIDRKKGCFSHE